MRKKYKDEQRQTYNEAIEAINGLPITQERQIAKRALVRAYKDDLSRKRD